MVLITASPPLSQSSPSGSSGSSPSRARILFLSHPSRLLSHSQKAMLPFHLQGQLLRGFVLLLLTFAIVFHAVSALSFLVSPSSSIAEGGSEAGERRGAAFPGFGSSQRRQQHQQSSRTGPSAEDSSPSSSSLLRSRGGEGGGQGKGQLPPCRVLIQNSVAWHYEVLESMMHLPTEMLFGQQLLSPPSSGGDCDRGTLAFDFALASDEEWGHMEERRAEWIQYFQTSIVARYDGRVGDGGAGSSNRSSSNRHHRDYNILAGELVPYDRTTANPKYRVVVEASCYCDQDYIDWVGADDRRRCMLHRTCNETSDNPNFWSASPYSNPPERFFFPYVFPPVDSSAAEREQTTPGRIMPPYQLCVVGKTKKRNFDFIRNFFREGKSEFGDQVTLQLHGRGWFPNQLKRFRGRVKQTRDTSGFVEYERQIAHECDVILALLEKKSHEQYFTTTLTGTMPQASAYNVPLVIHEDLAQVYRTYLPDLYETHTDDVDSFVAALDRILGRIHRQHFALDQR